MWITQSYPPTHPHELWTNLVMAGIDLNTVRELLGHSEIKMTLVYAHLAPEHKASAVAKLIQSEPFKTHLTELTHTE